MLFIALGKDFPNIEYHRVKQKAAYLGMKNLWSMAITRCRLISGCNSVGGANLFFGIFIKCSLIVS